MLQFIHKKCIINKLSSCSYIEYYRYLYIIYSFLTLYENKMRFFNKIHKLYYYIINKTFLSICLSISIHEKMTNF